MFCTGAPPKKPAAPEKPSSEQKDSSLQYHEFKPEDYRWVRKRRTYLGIDPKKQTERSSFHLFTGNNCDDDVDIMTVIMLMTLAEF